MALGEWQSQEAVNKALGLRGDGGLIFSCVASWFFLWLPPQEWARQKMPRCLHLMGLRWKQSLKGKKRDCFCLWCQHWERSLSWDLRIRFAYRQSYASTPSPENAFLVKSRLLSRTAASVNCSSMWIIAEQALCLARSVSYQQPVSQTCSYRVSTVLWRGRA